VTGGADVAATAQRLIAFYDGKFRVEIAATAAGGATSITPEDLPAPIPSGGTLSLISGTGPATVTTSAVGALGDRTLAVTALASGITAGAVYEYIVTGAGLPITPDGNNINITWDNGANKMFKL
jgi:hypothetical protein